MILQTGENMVHCCLRYALIAGLCLPAVVVTHAQDDKIAASLSQISGRVQVFQKASGETVQAYSDMVLRPGDTLVTGEQSHVTLRLGDRTQIRLGPKSKIEVREKGDGAPVIVIIPPGRKWAQPPRASGP
jgi:hypothetical protein